MDDSSSNSEEDLNSSSASGKKVRFDLNDEVFEIPNKWDRLSMRTNARREKLVQSVCKNVKVKMEAADRRSKNKQSKSKKTRRTQTAKKTDTKSRVSSNMTRTLASPSSQVLSLETTVLSTQKGGGNDRISTVENRTKKATQNSTPEVKLKLSHRGVMDSPSNDIVLPKITYSSDLKKAIENAVVRNRNPQEVVGSLSSAKKRERNYRVSPQDIFDSQTQNQNTNFQHTMNYHDQTRHTNTPNRNSINDETFYSTRKKERLIALPEYEPNFSELSRNVESWIPFNGAGEPSQGNPRRNSRSSSIQPTWIIPNSILY